MDLKLIQVRQDLERMVINYFLRGSITEEQSDQICNFLDRTIGGGDFPKPGRGEYRGVIQFPTSYNGNTKPKVDKEQAGENDHETPGYAKGEIINAPYGKALPDNVPDFREILQRDGLILIKWEKRVSDEGTFYNVLWSKTDRRNTEWSGKLREEYLPYALPLDIDYSHYFHKDTRRIYAVQVAPENILNGSLAEFTAYLLELKNAGIKNASGKPINFDYVFNFAAEKRTRWLWWNREFIDLKLSTRVINALNDRQVYTVKQLQKNITVHELLKARNLGKQTVTETLALLAQAGITLKEGTEEIAEPEKNDIGDTSGACISPGKKNKSEE